MSITYPLAPVLHKTRLTVVAITYDNLAYLLKIVNY